MQDRALVLLVEDDEILANMVETLIGHLAEVTWADSAEKGRELIRQREWDLVMCDIELPGMNGIEFLREIKPEQPVVASLILSSHKSFDFAVEAIRAGADDYMTKPVEPEALVEKVSELIAISRERRRTANSRHEIVLAIGAHPDDVEIGCGGSLVRHAEEGHDVAVLTLTGGEQGGSAHDRADESIRAAELMGAQLFHLDLDDTSVSEGAATISAIKTVIDMVQPTTIYTHTIKDVHQDHRNVHSATLVAARAVPRIFCYQAPSSTIDFRPTRFLSIDGQMDKKIEVIGAFASQTSMRTYLDEELLRATARYWARFTRSRYVEPLEVVRDSDAAAGPAPVVFEAPADAPAGVPADAS